MLHLHPPPASTLLKATETDDTGYNIERSYLGPLGRAALSIAVPSSWATSGKMTLDEGDFRSKEL